MQGSQEDEGYQIQELADQQEHPKSDQGSNGPKKVDPETYEVEQANQEPAKESKRVKKQQAKLAAKQEFFLDSQQLAFVNFEAQSISSIPHIPSQVTNHQDNVEPEYLNALEQFDKKSPTLKSLKTTKYWINLKGKFCD